jgi:HK97 family phage major capsid protein
MSEENIVKEAISDMGKAFEEFKATNDKRLAEIEEKGSADPLTEEKLAKIEADMDKLEDVNQALTKQAQAQDQVKDQVDRIETMLKRPEMGLSTQDIDEKAVVFEKYLRKGKESLDEMELKVLTVSNDTTGGYLAPPEYVQEMLKTVTEMSPIRSIARIRSTGQRSVQMPKQLDMQLGWKRYLLTKCTHWLISLNKI